MYTALFGVFYMAIKPINHAPWPYDLSPVLVIMNCLMRSTMPVKFVDFIEIGKRGSWLNIFLKGLFSKLSK
jgi:hypothetical protein